MKTHLITTFIIAGISLAAQAGVQWQNYPTTNTLGNTDTLLAGNGQTNVTITVGNLKTVVASSGSGIPWAPITFGWLAQTLNAGEERFLTERGSDTGSTTSQSNLPRCPIGLRSRILTNIVVQVGTGAGDPIGAGTNVMFRFYTNSVYTGVSVHFQSNNTYTLTNSGTASLTLSGGANNYWAVGVSNEAASAAISSGSVTVHAECITQ